MAPTSDQPKCDPAALRRAATKVVARLRAAGHRALFAGGCVRDLLLEREPTDYDVATSAPATEVQKIFQRSIPVGIQFGVVLVMEGDFPFEVATFRRDGAYLDHRHPASVFPGSAEEDAQRRDFTINGLFLDPETNEVLDFVGGRKDLLDRVIRAIGDPLARFDEDRLRLIRAVRFAARFGFEIEPGTRAAIRSLAHTLPTIAWERIGEEIVKILGEADPRLGFELISELGLLPQVLPEVATLREVRLTAKDPIPGSLFDHVLDCLGQLSDKEKRGISSSEALALAVTLQDIGIAENGVVLPMASADRFLHCERSAVLARQVCIRLRRSNETAERVAWLVKNRGRHFEAPSMGVAELKRYLAVAGIQDLLELARIDLTASRQSLGSYEFCMTKLSELSDADLRPPPLLRGQDLIELGFRPGPLFREILERAMDAQLEGNLTTTAEARAWLQASFSNTGSTSAPVMSKDQFS